MKSLVVIQWRKSLDGERSDIRGYKSTTDRRWDVILTLCSPARPCQSSSSLYYYYISGSSSLSSSTNQLKWEFKLEIDWRLACVPFSTLIVCVCVCCDAIMCVLISCWQLVWRHVQWKHTDWASCSMVRAARAPSGLLGRAWPSDPWPSGDSVCLGWKHLT